MPQRYDKYKIKAILLFSIIICLFAMRFIYYSTLLKHVEDKADFDFLFKESIVPNCIEMKLRWIRIDNDRLVVLNF